MAKKPIEAHLPPAKSRILKLTLTVQHHHTLLEDAKYRNSPHIFRIFRIWQIWKFCKFPYFGFENNKQFPRF